MKSDKLELWKKEHKFILIKPLEYKTQITPIYYLLCKNVKVEESDS